MTSRPDRVDLQTVGLRRPPKLGIWSEASRGSRLSPERLLLPSRRLDSKAPLVPTWLGLAVFHLWLWPWRIAAGHLVIVGLVGLMVAEIWLAGFRKIPFTCSYQPGKSRINMAFVIGGILVWAFFNNTLIGASTSFTRNPNLISKVYFPIEALPISMVLANFVNFLIPLSLLLVVLVIGGIPLGWSLVLLPVVALGQLALCIGCALAIASLTVFLRDVEHFLVLGLQVVFYVTPILYPLSAKAMPRAATAFLPLLHLNPLSWYLGCYHAILYDGHWPDLMDFTLMVLCSLLVLGLGFLVFIRLRPRLPESV